MVEGVTSAGRRAQGFTLIEVAVGLALLAVATLLGLAAITQARLAIERLEARQRALREIEAALEAVQAGALPLVSGEVGPSLEATRGRERNLIVYLRVKPGSLPGLYQVAGTACWTLRGRPQSSTVLTRVYRP